MALPSPRRLRTRVGFIGTGQVAEELGTAPCTCVLHVACARIGVPTDGSRPATCFVSAGLRVMIGSQQITRAQALAAQIGAEHSRWLGVMAMEAGNAGSGMQALKKHIRHPMARACACIHACLRPRLHSQYSASLHMSIHTSVLVQGIRPGVTRTAENMPLAMQMRTFCSNATSSSSQVLDQY